MIKAYQALWLRLTASRTVKPKTHILNNKASAEFKREIQKNPLKVQSGIWAFKFYLSKSPFATKHLSALQLGAQDVDCVWNWNF